MKKVVIILIIIVIGFFLLTNFYKKGSHPLSKPTPSLEKNIYSSPAYGFSFAIPQGYILNEGMSEEMNGTPHSIITLIRNEDVTPPSNGEHPPTITLEVIPAEQKSLLSWFYNSASSTALTARAGSYASTTIAGTEGISYEQSGLYEVKTIAVEHDNYHLIMSVAYISPNDSNLSAFKEVTESLVFKK